MVRVRSTNWRFLSSISGVSGTLEKIATLWTETANSWTSLVFRNLHKEYALWCWMFGSHQIFITPVCENFPDRSRRMHIIRTCKKLVRLIVLKPGTTRGRKFGSSTESGHRWDLTWCYQPTQDGWDLTWYNCFTYQHQENPPCTDAHTRVIADRPRILKSRAENPSRFCDKRFLRSNKSRQPTSHTTRERRYGSRSAILCCIFSLLHRRIAWFFILNVRSTVYSTTTAQ